MVREPKKRPDRSWKPGSLTKTTSRRRLKPFQANHFSSHHGRFQDTRSEACTTCKAEELRLIELVLRNHLREIEADGPQRRSPDQRSTNRGADLRRVATKCDTITLREANSRVVHQGRVCVGNIS